jgi:hypothetical protein
LPESLRPVSQQNTELTPEPLEGVPACPICKGRMEMVYSRHLQTVCVCVDCHSGLSVPTSAYEVARLKREGKFN